MTPSRWILNVIATVTLLTQPIMAGPKSPGLTGSAAPEGLEFNDPLVGETMDLVRAGQADQAIDQLRKEASNAIGARGSELKLGLAMVFLRTGQRAKATPVLKALMQADVERSISLRAKVLTKAASRMRSSGLKTALKDAAELASDTRWNEALTGVAKDIDKEITREHQYLSDAIGKGNGDKMVSHLTNAQGLLVEADVIKAPEAAEARYEIGRKHVEALAREIHQMNDLIDSQVRSANVLYARIADEVRGGNRLRRRARGAADPEAVVQYNQICDSISQAWEAGKRLEAEFEDVQNQKGYHLTFNKRVFLKVPRDSLPKPFQRP